MTNGTRRRALIAGVGALNLAAGCTGGGSPARPGEKAATLRILAGSELADLKPILDEAKKDIGITVKLDYTGTLAGVQQVLDGTAGRDHEAIWFSSNRYLALHAAAQAKLGPSVKIMSSPVLLGLRASTARRLGWTVRGQRGTRSPLPRRPGSSPTA